MQPLVAVGVVEMPVSVDQLPDRIGTEACESLENARSCGRYTGIDQELPVVAGQHGHIAARALEHTDIATKLVDPDRSKRSRFPDAVNDITGLSKDLARCQPSARRRERRDAETAQAETTA